MDLLLDPNIAYMILVVGFVLGVLALFTPGTGFLEVGVLLAIILAGYAIIRQPVNLWALILLAFGVIPFLIALRKFKKWLYLVPAIVSIVVGSVFLFRTETGGPAINPVLATLMSAITVVMLWVIGRKGIEALGLQPSQDLSALIGQTGVARSDIRNSGSIYVGGEEWTARSEKLIKEGNPARVIGREGLVLLVEPVDKEN
ncbi:MAG TPA: NfeD family protein [Anaerolineaceae bacterium]|jgi:membrane-bound serine protease (ClpP class)|nr:NfeD family protein [Anaerolineaceae bacterium]